MNQKIIFIIILTLLLLLLLYYIGSSNESDLHKLALPIDITKEKDDYNFIDFFRLWFPNVSEKEIISALNSCPKYTFPINGICEDGELVSDVLKRLEFEGNREKINFFKKNMGLPHFDNN